MTYTFIEDLHALTAEIPQDSIVSRTIHDEQSSKTILFGFAAGQELSEHTASMPATLYFLHGSGKLTLGEDSYAVQAGSWTQMPAKLPHSIVAETPMLMLLTLMKGG